MMRSQHKKPVRRPYTFYRGEDSYTIYGTKLEALQYAAWQENLQPRPAVPVLVKLKVIARPMIIYPYATDNEAVFSREETMFGVVVALYLLERKLHDIAKKESKHG